MASGADFILGADGARVWVGWDSDNPFILVEIPRVQSDLTTEQARALAAILVRAADELEGAAK